MLNHECIKNALHWRYAAKQFDSEQKIAEEKIYQLMKMANLTATSMGLQPFRVLWIKNPRNLKDLGNATFYQKQISTCSDLIVLAARTDLGEDFVKEMIQLMEEERGLQKGDLQDYEQTCIKFLKGLKNSNELQHWVDKQIYIVLGTLLTACALMQIDSCPMEGFKKHDLDEILNLEKKNLRSVLLLPVGIRTEKDFLLHEKKVRIPLDEMLIELN